MHLWGGGFRGPRGAGERRGASGGGVGSSPPWRGRCGTGGAGGGSPRAGRRTPGPTGGSEKGPPRSTRRWR